jgi:hypothetical protein
VFSIPNRFLIVKIFIELKKYFQGVFTDNVKPLFH